MECHLPSLGNLIIAHKHKTLGGKGLFGFGNAEAGRVAEILVPAVAYYLEKYGTCEDSALAGMIAAEVPTGHFALMGSAAQVAPPELPAFQLMIEIPPFGSEYGVRQVSAIGRESYVSFGLVADGPKSNWFCYAGGAAMPPRDRAKRLVKMLQSEHGIMSADAPY